MKKIDDFISLLVHEQRFSFKVVQKKEKFVCTISSFSRINEGQKLIFRAENPDLFECILQCMYNYDKDFSYMPFEVIRRPTDVSSYYLDEVYVSYQNLVDLFGRPGKGDGYKVDAEWILRFKDDKRSFCTIYNYKDGKNYLGKHGLHKKDIREWHIGGNDRRVVGFVKKLLKVY